MFFDRVASRVRWLHARRRERTIQRRLIGPQLLRCLGRIEPRPYFVEIGANDGVQHDHLREFILRDGWPGIMVEPVPYIFDRLRRNYGGTSGIVLENVAIADRTAVLPFYHLIPREERDDPSLPDWYDGIGSFSREAVVGHIEHIPDVEDRIVETHVPCMTFDDLWERNGQPDIKVITIDTEGYDLDVLRTIDLERHHPRIVVYEHFHLSSAARAEAQGVLRAAGYVCLEEGFDTWCVDPVSDDVLTRRWRTASPALPGLYANRS